MPLWVAATVTAALFQTWRTALQQRLRGQLSVNAAAVVRYLYGVPVGMALVGLYLLIFGGVLSAPTPMFFLYAALGGLGQIIGTNLLIMSFAHRGFAVGTAYAKTEAVQAAFLALLLLGENFAPLAWAGIAVSVGGTLYLSLAGRVGSLGEMLRATVQPAAPMWPRRRLCLRALRTRHSRGDTGIAGAGCGAARAGNPGGHQCHADHHAGWLARVART